MAHPKSRLITLCVGFFLFVLIADQVTKWAALKWLAEGEQVPIISGLFDLTLVFNKGAAFGMFATLPDTIRRVSLGGVSVIALLVIVYMFRETKGQLHLQLALCGILAGAIGNIIDRVRYDAVVDFLDFYLGNYHWPAFNVADSAIVVGVALLVVNMLFQQHPADTVADGE